MTSPATEQNTTGSFERFLTCLALFIVPTWLCALLLGSLIADHECRLLRGAIFLLSLGITAFRPHWGAVVVIASLGWFENPVLYLKLPNQFLVESGIIGFLTACTFRQLVLQRSSTRRESLRALLGHPFTLMGGFAVIAGLLSFATEIGELYQFSSDRISPWAVLRTTLAKGFHSDVRSPVHGLSILIGYAVAIAFGARLLADWTKLRLSTSKILWTLLLASLPIAALALHQAMNRSSYHLLEYAEGTFQNGNHLSFFGCLTLIWICQTMCLTPTRRQDLWRWAVLISMTPLAFTIAMIGLGRGSWVGFLSAALLVYIGNLVICLVRRRWLPFSLGTGALLAGIASLLYLGPGIFSHCPSLLAKPCRLASKLTAIVDSLRFDQLLFAANRRPIFETALDFLQTSPITGVGVGNFWLQSGLGHLVHNQYLSWSVEFGILGALVFLIAISVATAQYWRLTPSEPSRSERFFNGMTITAIVGICISSTVDVYLSYRSLGLIVGVWLLAIIQRRWQSRPLAVPIAGRKTLTLTMGLAAIYGAITVIQPQTRPRLDQSYGRENNTQVTRSFRWQAPIKMLAWDTNQCRGILLQAIGRADFGYLRVGVYNRSEKPNPPLRISDWPSWEETIQHLQRIPILNNNWRGVCLCPSPDLSHRIDCAKNNSCLLYLAVEDGKFPSFARRRSLHDYRYLSFAWSDWGNFARDDIADGLLTENQRCDVRVDIGSAH